MNLRNISGLLILGIILLFTFQNCSKTGFNTLSSSPQSPIAKAAIDCVASPSNPYCNGSAAGNGPTSPAVASPSNVFCSFAGTQIPNGQSIFAYVTSSVPSGQKCQRQLRVCLNRTMTGSGDFTSCKEDGAPKACLFNGQTILHGTSVPAFAASEVTSNNQCVSENRICNDGVLTGSLKEPTCRTLIKIPPVVQSAPPVPTGLVLTSTTTSQIVFSWNQPDPSARVTAIRIYRDGILLSTLPAIVRFPDSNLPAATTHSYTVAAGNSEGLWSAQSNPLTASTLTAIIRQPPVTPPNQTIQPQTVCDVVPVPTNIKINNTFDLDGSVTISWDLAPYMDKKFNGFHVYLNSQRFDVLATTGGSLASSLRVNSPPLSNTTVYVTALGGNCGLESGPSEFAHYSTPYYRFSSPDRSACETKAAAHVAACAGGPCKFTKCELDGAASCLPTAKPNEWGYCSL